MLELKNVSAGYGGRAVLEGVDITVKKARLTSVIGVNGCGKSTLLKAMLGILPPVEGTVTVDGARISELSRNAIARRIAYLPQGKNVPDMTVWQMVLHGRFPYLSYPRRYTEKDREIAYSAMERVGICGLAQEMLGALSGGMRQMAYIAMALAQDTEYILLDEPTTYLDIARQLELMRLLRRLADDGRGIVTVMHDLPLAFGFSDEIAVLQGGRVVAMDEPHRLSETDTVRRTFGVGVKYSTVEGKFFYA